MSLMWKPTNEQRYKPYILLLVLDVDLSFKFRMQRFGDVTPRSESKGGGWGAGDTRTAHGIMPMFRPAGRLYANHDNNH